MDDAEPRRSLLIPAWAALLLGLTALAAWDGAPSALRPQIAAGRLAVNGGLLLLGLVAVVLPLRRGGPRRLATDLALVLVVAAPFAIAARDWTPLTRALAAPYLALLASQAVLAAAAAWAGVARHGRAASVYLAAVVFVLLGLPYLTYLAGEATSLTGGGLRFASSLAAARVLLLDRADPLPSGFWTPAVGVNLALAAGFAVRATLRRRDS
jgi:hypothetical protein